MRENVNGNRVIERYLNSFQEIGRRDLRASVIRSPEWNNDQLRNGEYLYTFEHTYLHFPPMDVDINLTTRILLFCFPIV